MAKKKKEKKIFVLDTSVLLHNAHAIHTFEEHDVVIPITVLEEIDTFKKGNDTKNFEAREFIRQLDAISEKGTLTEWVALNGKTKGNFKITMNVTGSIDAVEIFGDDKPDHRILNAAISISGEYPDQKVILVTKDINLRLKARSLNILAEDYETGKIKNVDELYTGNSLQNSIDKSVIDKLYEQGTCSPAEAGIKDPPANHFFILKSGRNSVLTMYDPRQEVLLRIDKQVAYGVTPRNAEQIFALQAIMDDNIKLVTLQGKAGSGKTLIALAGALQHRRNYRQIYLARPIVPLSNKDIGYLPGDIKSKVNPYMEPLWDNLKMIQNQYSEKDKEFRRITEMVENEKLMITPLAYIRGRSLSNIIFIVDEAQNLTPHEIKTVITRAGENTKIIFTGDIYQIDTPYLDSQSNGLSYLIDKLKGDPLYAHITLIKGERSELANLASEKL